MNVRYLERGNRSEKIGLIAPFYYFWDLAVFTSKLFSLKPIVVVVNSSFNASNTIRDLCFIGLTRLFRNRVVLFYHGWSPSYVESLKSNKRLFVLQKQIIRFSDKIVVLSERFKKDLALLGLNKNCALAKTCVSQKLLESGFHHKLSLETENETLNFIVVSRLEKNKNVESAIKIFSQVQNLRCKSRKICLYIMGTGSEMTHLQRIVNNTPIQNVFFLGFLNEEEKISVLKKSHFYLNPSENEGLPISLLEAMTIGLPVFTVKSGGIADFFEEPEMGLGQKKLDIEKAAIEINRLVDQIDKLRKISEFNRNYAQLNFGPAGLAGTLHDIFTNHSVPKYGD